MLSCEKMIRAIFKTKHYYSTVQTLTPPGVRSHVLKALCTVVTVWVNLIRRKIFWNVRIKTKINLRLNNLPIIL